MRKKYIYIGAEWCGPCKLFKPKFESICKEKKLDYEILDVEENSDKISKYNIRNVPVIVIEDENGNILNQGMASNIIQEIGK